MRSSNEATEKHHISQDQAINHGKPLRDALQVMMHDILECCAKGGRIVAHHLDFDAGIISQELQRAGLMNYKDAFEREVRRGICTMDAQGASNDGYTRNSTEYPNEADRDDQDSRSRLNYVQVIIQPARMH